VNPIWHKYLEKNYNVLAQLFAGYGYDIPDQPDNFEKEITEKIVVSIELKDFKHHEQLFCSNRLLKHDVGFHRKELPK